VTYEQTEPLHSKAKESVLTWWEREN